MSHTTTTFTSDLSLSILLMLFWYFILILIIILLLVFWNFFFILLIILLFFFLRIHSSHLNHIYYILDNLCNYYLNLYNILFRLDNTQINIQYKYYIHNLDIFNKEPNIFSTHHIHKVPIHFNNLHTNYFHLESYPNTLLSF